MPQRLINWELISNPANWFVVFLMVAIASVGITSVYASWTANQGN